MSEKDHDCSIPVADMMGSCPNCYRQGEHVRHNRCLRLVEPGLWICLSCDAVYEVVKVTKKRVCGNNYIRLKRREDLVPHKASTFIGVEEVETQTCDASVEETEEENDG